MLWYPSLPAGMHCGNFTTDQTVPPAVSLSGYQGISGICLKSVITDGSLNDRYNRRQSTTPPWRKIVWPHPEAFTEPLTESARSSLSPLLAGLQTVWQRCRGRRVQGVWGGRGERGACCRKADLSSCTIVDSTECDLVEIDDMICWQGLFTPCLVHHNSLPVQIFKTEFTINLQRYWISWVQIRKQK